MSTELEKRINIHTEIFNKEPEYIKKDPIGNEEFNSWGEKKKTTLEGMNSRLNDTERRMPKSAGRQNKENHPIITAKRKTN